MRIFCHTSLNHTHYTDKYYDIVTLLNLNNQQQHYSGLSRPSLDLLPEIEIASASANWHQVAFRETLDETVKTGAGGGEMGVGGGGGLPIRLKVGILGDLQRREGRLGRFAEFRTSVRVKGSLSSEKECSRLPLLEVQDIRGGARVY